MCVCRVFAFAQISLFWTTLRGEITLVEWGALATVNVDMVIAPNVSPNCYDAARPGMAHSQ